MKIILKIGLAALLVAFLAVPGLAQKHQSGGTRPPTETSKEPQAKQSEVKDSHDRYGIDGEYKDKDHKGETTLKTQTGSQVPPSGVKGKSIGY
jgi:hypothetical protein